MTKKQILDLLEIMQWDLSRMPIGSANEYAKQLELIKTYIKEDK